MTKAFVETTVLADALLKPGPRASAAKAAILRYEQSLLPVYSIKEFKSGPLKHYVWVHGKLVTTGSWVKTLSQLQKTAMSSFQKRRISTALEALEAVSHKDRNVTMEQLVKKYGSLATQDAVTCDRHRLSLRSIIMRAWKMRRLLTSSVVNELSCYPETDPIEERGLIDLRGVVCRPQDECSLAAVLRQNPTDLAKMRKAIMAQPPKEENTKRSKVLRTLIRSKQKIDQKQCRYLGDAVFAYFCPVDAVVLTTNLSDLDPLTLALGKKAVRP